METFLMWQAAAKLLAALPAANARAQAGSKADGKARAEGGIACRSGGLIAPMAGGTHELCATPAGKDGSDGGDVERLFLPR